MYQLLSYGIYRLVIGAHTFFSENSCELLRNYLHIGESEAEEELERLLKFIAWLRH